MTIYRFKNRSNFEPVTLEIEYGGDGRWQVIGGTPNEQHNWDTYEESVVVLDQDPVGGEGVRFPTPYFIDDKLTLPVTKAWLENQRTGKLDIS